MLTNETFEQVRDLLTKNLTNQVISTNLPARKSAVPEIEFRSNIFSHEPLTRDRQRELLDARNLYFKVQKRLSTIPQQPLEFTIVNSYKRSRDNNLRNIKFRTIYQSGKTIHQQKVSIPVSTEEIKDLQNNYGVRLNLAIEYESDDLSQMEIDNISCRFRRSYLTQFFRIDLTQRFLNVPQQIIVNSQSVTPDIFLRQLNNLMENGTGIGEGMTVQYEFEIEILNSGSNPQDLSQLLTNFQQTVSYLPQIIQMYLDTRVLYTEQELNSLNISFGRSLNGKAKIFKSALVQSRNLKLRDLVDGGIINSKNGPYSITLKADGSRRILAINQTGIWLIYPTTEYNLIHRWKGILNAEQNKFLGSAFDCELLSPDQSGVSGILIFDCMAFVSDDDNPQLIQNYPHLKSTGHSLTQSSGNSRKRNDEKKYYKNENSGNWTRYQKVEEIVKLLNTIGKLSLSDDPLHFFRFAAKEFFPFTTSEEFFNIINGLSPILEPFDLGQTTTFYPHYTVNGINFPFAIDGMIFTPSYPYNPQSHRFTNRKLTHIPDVCKWKPTRLLTIDFMIDLNSEGQIDLYNYDRTLGQVAFRGDINYRESDKNLGINPFNPSQIDITGFTFIPKMIVEMGWDATTQKLKYYRSREEKGEANSLDIAIDDWIDIHKPLRLATLSGKTFELVFRYHNKIKTQLISRHIEINDIVLDIGAGGGGDIYKLKMAQKVYAVEPDLKNITELRQRLDASSMKDKYTVIQAYGQETEKITVAMGQDKASVIILMLSLSFFWQTSEYLQMLINTIKAVLAPGGRILFLTQNGDAIKEAAEPILGGETNWVTLADQSKVLTLGVQQGANFLDKSASQQGVQFQLFPRIPGSGRRLDVQIPGIVGLQTEYLVFIRDLILRLQEFNVELQEISRATNEKFLTTAEKNYTAFYSYGYFEATKSLTEKDSRRKAGRILQKTAIETELSKMKIVPGPLSEDQVADLLPSWLGDPSEVILKRVGNINDQNSFLHPILRALNQNYQEQIGMRKNIAQSYRGTIDITGISNRYKELYKIPGKTRYEIMGNGIYMQKILEQLGNPALVSQSKRSYEISALQNYLRSDAPLSFEDMDYLFMFFRVNVTILYEEGNELKFYTSSIYRPDFNRNLIFLINPRDMSIDNIFVMREIDSKVLPIGVLSNDDPLIKRIHSKFAPSTEIMNFDEHYQYYFHQYIGNLRDYSLNPLVKARVDCLLSLSDDNPVKINYGRLYQNLQ